MHLVGTSSVSKVGICQVPLLARRRANTERLGPKQSIPVHADRGLWVDAGTLSEDGRRQEPDMAASVPQTHSGMEYDGDGSGCMFAWLRRSDVSRIVLPSKRDSVKEV